MSLCHLSIFLCPKYKQAQCDEKRGAESKSDDVCASNPGLCVAAITVPL